MPPQIFQARKSAANLQQLFGGSPPNNTDSAIHTANKTVETVEKGEKLTSSPLTAASSVASATGVMPPALKTITDAVLNPAGSGPAAGTATKLPAANSAYEEKIEVVKVLKVPEPDKPLTEGLDKKIAGLVSLIREHQKFSNEELAQLCSGYLKLDRTGKHDKQLQEMLNDKAFAEILTDDQKRYIRARAVAGERGISFISKDIAENIPADQSKLMQSHRSFERAAHDPAIPKEMSDKAVAAAERGIRSYNLARAILSGNETEAAKLRIDGDPSRSIPDSTYERKEKLLAAIDAKEAKMVGNPAIRQALTAIPAVHFESIGNKLAPFMSSEAPLIHNKAAGGELLAVHIWGERVAEEAAKAKAKPAAPAVPLTAEAVPAPAAATDSKAPIETTKPNDPRRVESFNRIAADGMFGSSRYLDELNSLGRDDVWINQTNITRIAKAAPVEALKSAASGAGAAPAAGTAAGSNDAPAAETTLDKSQRFGTNAKDATKDIPVVGHGVGLAVDLGNGAANAGKKVWSWIKPKKKTEENGGQK